MNVGDLTRNAVDVLPSGELEKKLALGRPLRVKLGIDVTAPHIHLGNGIPLQRMRAFQDAGHTGVLIVGDYTARIGDPSGASAERPIIAPEEIDRMAARFFESAYTILIPERTEVRFNGEWLAKVDFAEVLRLTRTVTVARILERDDFAKRFAAQQAIAVEADVELGGTDQLYNLLTGRDVMEAYGLEPQVVLTTPLIDSWDGTKMSGSKGNYIALSEDPNEQFGKTMRLPDELLFTRVVREGEAPADVPEAELPAGDPLHLPALLVEHFGVGSTSEARRLISQGAVKIDGEPATEIDVPRARLDGALVQAGKRRFMRFSGA